MSHTPLRDGTAAFAEMRRYKAMFDNTWTLSTVLATALAVISWYFGLAQVDIGPVVWSLAAMALAQLALSSLAIRASQLRLQISALASQLLGTVMMGTVWHLFGGLQQPLFPLFIVLPLLTGALLLGFWQQQAATVALLLVLFSGIVLSADTNSFIEARYGIHLMSPESLPVWVPRSRIAFADVTTSPGYDLMMMATVAVIAFAVSTSARALVNLCARGADRVRSLEEDLERQHEALALLVKGAPGAEVLVMAGSGRIVHASDEFSRVFDIPAAEGLFLLDSVAFAYPGVIKKLMSAGGSEIQGARVRGRDSVLRIRAGIVGSGQSQMARLALEACDDVCWRGAVDALEEPVFALNAQGEVVFLNRAAATVFGEEAHGASGSTLFEAGAARWWDIAPLESARRLLDRGGRRYFASIRRERIADSVGELSFVHLHEREPVHAVAVS